MNRIVRLLRHLLELRLTTRSRFTSVVLDRVEAAVGKAEASHAGELRVVIETDLDIASILAGRSSRDRAVEIFSATRIWDTELNNGVLLYVLCADRRVEIVADRGFNALVSAEEWRAACASMEQAFRAGRWEAGLLAGVDAAAGLLSRHFPGTGRNGNELPDRPILL
jgi:uncharacterized membrane protein